MNYPQEACKAISAERLPEVHDLIQNIHSALTCLQDEISTLEGRISCVCSAPSPQTTDVDRLNSKSPIESAVGSELFTINNRISVLSSVVRDIRNRLCV